MQRAPHALNRRMREDCSLAAMHAERRPVDGAGAHCKRLLVVDVLKLIDEIAKLAFAVAKRDALNPAPQEDFGSYPEILLEFRTGPDWNVRTTRFDCRRAKLAEASAAREPFGWPGSLARRAAKGTARSAASEKAPYELRSEQRIGCFLNP